MRVWTVGLLALAVALPAYAGQGTIEETDDCIIVEYTGDAPSKSAGTTTTTAMTAMTDTTATTDTYAAARPAEVERATTPSQTEIDSAELAREAKKRARARRPSRRSASDIPAGDGG